jgi:2-polyprenyl-3-methyl-5-hydroxy-6-metoxy-1,4-benzoquinol methylase
MQTLLCLHCGVARTHPLPSEEELTHFYQEEYRQEYKGVITPRGKHVLRAARLARQRLWHLLPHLPAGSRLLDLGAGGGEFVAVARAAGLDAEGLEPHAGYANHAAQVLGLPVRQGIWQSADIAPGSLQALTMFHVLEHLPNPVTCLRAVLAWLAPGGWLLLEVPNLIGPLSTRSRRFHRAHLVHFTPLSLTGTVRRAGFHVVWANASADGGNVVLLAQRPVSGDRPDGDAAVPQSPSLVDAADEITRFESSPAYPLHRLPAHLMRLVRRWVSLLEEQWMIRRHRDARSILDGFVASAPLRAQPGEAGRGRSADSSKG